MIYEIEFTSETNKSIINDLRTKAYSVADGYTVDLSTLNWKDSDNDSFVMVAKHQGQIVATMRGEVINDSALVEKKLECPWDFSAPLELPALLLSRAATEKSHQAQGLNLLLRYWFLKFAVFHKIPLVIGTFVSGSPRQNTLSNMGYDFFENKLGWQQSTYRSHRSVIVAVLNLQQNQENALNYCQQQFAQTNAASKFIGHFPELRYVRTL